MSIPTSKDLVRRELADDHLFDPALSHLLVIDEKGSPRFLTHSRSLSYR
jgi:hypothetical protein